MKNNLNHTIPIKFRLQGILEQAFSDRPVLAFFSISALEKSYSALSKLYGHRDSSLTHKHSIKIEIFKKFWNLIFRSKKVSGSQYGLFECK